MENIRDVYKRLAELENKDTTIVVFDGHYGKYVESKVYGIYNNNKELVDFIGR